MGGVEVRTGAIVRSWQRAGDVRVLLRSSADADDVRRVLFAASEPEGVLVEWVRPSPEGPVAFLNPLGEQDMTAWLDGAARALEGCGITGVLEPAPEVAYPSWIPVGPVPTAFLSWEFDRQAMATYGRQSGRWLVSPSTSARLGRTVAEWGRSAGPQVILGGELKQALSDPADLDQLLAGELHRYDTTAALWTTDGATTGRYVGMDAGGSGLAQVLAVDLAWTVRIEALRDLILRSVDQLHQAFIRPARTTAPSWTFLDRRLRLPAFSRATPVTTNRHLLDRFVPDAHGLQLLRDAHLERAHDLSGWIVTDLGNGRHLVVAPDLEPWYGGELPDPVVLDRARNDFGDMIITPETIAAHKLPTPPG